MRKNNYRTLAGETVEVRGVRWFCTGCRNDGKAKRNEVEMAASSHANTCREEDAEWAALQRQQAFRRNNVSDRQLRQLAAQFGGELTLNKETAAIVISGRYPRNGFWRENYPYRKNSRGTWDLYTRRR